jgi:hypothetical protein
MVDAYTSLHRATSGGSNGEGGGNAAAAVAPEEAVAGIIPPHKLKYLPLLIELIAKERLC